MFHSVNGRGREKVVAKGLVGAGRTEHRDGAGQSRTEQFAPSEPTKLNRPMLYDNEVLMLIKPCIC